MLNGNYFPAIPRYFGKLNFLNELNKTTAFDLEIYYAGKYFLTTIIQLLPQSYMLASLNVKESLYSLIDTLQFFVT